MTPVWNSGISFGFFQESGEIGRIGFTLFAIWSTDLSQESRFGIVLQLLLLDSLEPMLLWSSLYPCT